MKSNEYIKHAVRTNVKDLKDISNRFNSDSIIDLLHAAIGLSTESNELLDVFKKHLFYGKEIDMINVKEELGDICWYIAIILDDRNWTWEEIWTMNIEKLKKRYGENFSKDKALNRKLKEEREVLETRDCGKCYTESQKEIKKLNANIKLKNEIIEDFRNRLEKINSDYSLVSSNSHKYFKELNVARETLVKIRECIKE
jgi:NTP pyrophosphatase (non-canonical NTP hydrolase)